jgi:hypothetical protein
VSPYVPSLIVAGLAIAAVLLVRRGSVVVRAGVAVVAVLPVHAALVALRPDRGCLLLGSVDDCLRELNLPGDLLRAHAVLAACAVVALLAYLTAHRMTGRRTGSRGA